MAETKPVKQHLNQGAKMQVARLRARKLKLLPFVIVFVFLILNVISALTLDTGLPTFTSNCSNNTFTRYNLTCKFIIEDVSPYNLTIRMYNGTNDYHANTSSIAVGKFINLTVTLNVTEDGNYTIVFISNSVFGLNVFDIFYTWINDRTSPSVISFNLTNNTFTKENNFNITINATDLYTDKVLLFIDNTNNVTTSFSSGAITNITLNASDGNYTLKLQFNDTSGNIINSTTRNLVIDTTIPTFVSAYNRTADSSNSTTITTSTDVNISIIGLDDLYLDRGNFSHNVSGSWVNYSITIIGNTTPYFHIIGKGNFTANQVVGWKFYVYDIAGNQLDPIYTFTIGSLPSGGGGTTGSGDTSSVLSQLSLLNPFGTEPINDICAEKEQLFDNRCYPCNPETGYLKFNPDDRSIICIGCNEGFILNKDTKKCELLPPTSIQQKFNFYIDETARRISNLFGTSNLMVGFAVVFISLFIFGYYFIEWFRKNA